MEMKKKKMVMKMGLGGVKSASMPLKKSTKSAAKPMKSKTKSFSTPMKSKTKSGKDVSGLHALTSKAHPTMGKKGWDPKASESENLKRILGGTKSGKKKVKNSSEYMSIIKGMRK